MKNEYNENYHLSKVESYTLQQQYKKLKNCILENYPDLTICYLKTFIGYKRDNKHNLLSVWFYKDKIEVCLGIHWGELNDPKRITHKTKFTLAEYGFYLDSNLDFNYIMDLINQTYNKHPY